MDFNRLSQIVIHKEFLTNYIHNSAGNKELIGVYQIDSGGFHMVNITEINGTTVTCWDAQKSVKSFVHMSDMVSFYGITP
jgi:hypothetical protein